MSLNFDKTYLYRMPTKIYYGFNSINSTSDEVKSLGGSKVMIVTDKGIMDAGLVAPLEKNFQDNDISYAIFADVDVDPGSKVCEIGARFFRDNDCDIIVVIGGGSPVCAAKGIAIVVTNKGDIRDYKGIEKFKISPVPMIAIPTTAGAGSEVSAATVLHDEDKNNETFTINGFHLFPKTAILDPLVLRKLPVRPYLFAGLDALTHAIESLYTVEGTPLTDALAYEAIKLMVDNMVKSAYSDDMEAKGMQLLANVMANMACGNAKLGLVHGTGGPINAMYHISHGMALGIMLPHVMEFNLPVAQDKFARLSDICCWSKPYMTMLEKAKAAVEGIRQLLIMAEVPSCIPTDIVSRDDIDKLVERSLTYPMTNTLNKRKPTASDIKKLYEKAFIGWE